VANVAGTLTNTIQNVDSLDGGAGTDTLNITHNTNTLVTPVLKNIENVVFRATAAGADIDFAASTGVTSVTVDNSTAATGVIDNVGTADLAVKNQNTAVSFDHQTGTTLKIAFDTVGKVDKTAPVEVAVDLGAATASKATTLNITTKNSNVEVKDTTGADVATSATIAATGVNEVKLTDGLALTALTVTGEGSVDVSEVGLVKVATLTAGDGGVTFSTGDSTATTFSATTGAGKDTLTVDGANVKTITTGAGDDKVTTATAALVATASIDLGAGNDTLTLHAAPAGAGVTLTGGEGTDTLATIYAAYGAIAAYGATDLAKITGFETLSITAAALANSNVVDLSKVAGLTSAQILGVANAGSASITNVGANSTVVIKGDMVTGQADGALTVSLKDATGGADVLNLTIDQAITQNNDGTVDTFTSAITGITTTGIETLNVTSTGTLGAAVTTGAKTDVAVNGLTLVNNDLATLKVMGDQALTFTSAAGMTKLATIDASTATAGLTFSGAAADMTTPTTSVAMTIKGSATAANTLTGSGHADTIMGGSARDVITGGKGGDNLSGNGGNDSFSFAAGDSSIGTGKFDTITDFVANTKGVGASGALTVVGATGVAVADLTGDVLSFAKFGTGAGGIVVDVLGSAADATTFLANNAATANAVLAALDSSNSNLYVDNTGDGVADFFIHLTGVTTINTGAFVLV
jgi:S-layer protein